MVKQKVFCLDCKTRVPENFFGQVQGTEFETGWRCENCMVKFHKR